MIWSFFSVSRKFIIMCGTVSKSKFREKNKKVIANRQNRIGIPFFFFFFFFFWPKNSISNPSSYIPSFCTFFFVAKHAVSKQLISLVYVQLHIQWNTRISKSNNCWPFLLHLLHRSHVFSIINDQLFIRTIAQPFSFFPTEKTKQCSEWSLLWRKD